MKRAKFGPVVAQDEREDANMPDDTRTLTVTVALPDRALCGNGPIGASKGYKIARSKMVKEQREAARNAASDARFKADGKIISIGKWFPRPLRVRVDVLVKRDPTWAARRLDDDNLIRGLKATMDGFTDAGVWADDRQVQWGEIEWESADPLRGEVVLTLSAVGDAGDRLRREGGREG